jgi:hypothetical protein
MKRNDFGQAEMRRRAAHGTRIAGIVITSLVLALAFLLSVGCAANMHRDHGHTAKAPQAKAQDWKPGKRCKTVGKAMTSHMAVMVERNCLKNGVTTANIVVLNSEKKGTVAAGHAAQAITSILGFKPQLKVLFYGKAKGKVFFLTAVTGVSGGVVAAKR